MKTGNRETGSLYIKALYLILFTVASSWCFAQQTTPEVREDFSDDELTSFVNAYENVLVVQQESEQKMVDAIENENLTLERFNEVLAMQQDPTMEMDATEDEMASFNNAAQAIIQERQAAESKVVSIIENEGLDVDTYQEIMIAYQYSPKVQERVNKLMESSVD